MEKVKKHATQIGQCKSIVHIESYMEKRQSINNMNARHTLPAEIYLIVTLECCAARNTFLRRDYLNQCN